MAFKDALTKAGISKASFARMARLNVRTVYRWEDAPGWAYALLDTLVEVEELRRKVMVLERLSQSLIDSDAPRRVA